MTQFAEMADDYVIAVKRERRADVPANWKEIVRGTSGVVVTGDASDARVQVQATAEAVAQIKERLADCVHIERVIRHRLS